MNKLQISNKVWLIIAGAILFIVLLIVIIRPAKKDADMSLTSYDGNVTLTIKNVSKGDANKGTQHLTRVKIDKEKDFYKEFIVNDPYYIGSLSKGGSLIDKEEKNATGSYLFLKNDRYFNVLQDGMYATITELMAIVKEGDDVYYLVFPCEAQFDMSMSGSLDYESLLTVKSFDDLAAFYRRLKDDYYLIEEAEQVITVKLIKDGQLSARSVTIRPTDTGVIVTAVAVEQ
ncbi:MAG: hypothetical protein IKX54_00130 [Lachnospiraceae bacterium]|nr:hypothetical protein [Lachnospiraceae bacterium]